MSHNSLPLAVTVTNQNHCLLHTNSHTTKSTPLNIYIHTDMVFCIVAAHTVGMYVLYLREKGPMDGAPYIESRLGDRPIFEVSLSQLDTKERPGRLPTQSSLFE